MPIDWFEPLMNGVLFEQVVGCLMSNANPEAMRVRPSTGDGGVDVFVPVDDGVIDVYQLKYSRQNIPWRRVEESLTPLGDGVWSGRTIRNWHLTVPRQPTPHQIRKLDTYADSVPFRLGWFAEDALAALHLRFPSVWDYYMRNGQQQLDQLMDDWETVLTPVRAGVQPRIEHVQDRLTEIAEILGRKDPHLDYGVEVHPIRFAIQPEAPRGALTMSQSVVGEHVVRCIAYPAYRGAAADAGDRFRVRLGVTDDVAPRIDRLHRFGGEPIILTPSQISELVLPRIGHRPPDGVDFMVRLTPVPDETSAALRLALTHDGTTTIVPMIREQITEGSEGATSIWRSPTGLFMLRIEVDRTTRRVGLALRQSRDIAGPIASIVDDLPMLRALSSNEVAIGVAAEHGPVDGDSVALGGRFIDSELVPVLDALRLIQHHTHDVVTVPSSLSTKEGIDLIETAALLEGLPITGDLRRADITIGMPRGVVEGDSADIFNELFSVAMCHELERTLTLPHQSVELASDLFRVRVIRSARTSRIEPFVDDATGTIDPEMLRIVLEPGMLPIWIDKRVGSESELTAELHAELCEYNELIPISEVSSLLALR